MPTTIDIRKTDTEQISTIKFSDRHSIEYVFGSIEIQEELDGTINTVLIDNRKDAENLIKALRKGIELGFFNY